MIIIIVDKNNMRIFHRSIYKDIGKMIPNFNKSIIILTIKNKITMATIYLVHPMCQELLKRLSIKLLPCTITIFQWRNSI
jgi:hypothetical protein